MSFFSSNTVKGPDVLDLKTTIENLQAALSSRDYVNGMDQTSTVAMVGGIYEYVIGKLTRGLPLPAPADYPDDKYKVMWPEGMKVKTRRTSVSSSGSRQHVSRKGQYDLSSNPAGRRAMSRASSVTSTSTYSRRYVGIAEEEDDDDAPLSARPPQLQREQSFRYGSAGYGIGAREMPTRSSRQLEQSTGTRRVDGAAMRPTPSMEGFMKPTHDVDEEPAQAERPPRRSNGAPRGKPRFADDE